MLNYLLLNHHSYEGLSDNETFKVFEENSNKRRKTAYSRDRKSGINILSDDSSLPFQTIVFRAGWAVKNLHSAFDYIFNSHQKDDSCAHVLAGWQEKDDNKYKGGFSPSFDAIQTHPEKAVKFTELLFIKQKGFLDREILKLLFASILRFYNDFEAVLLFEPTNKFESKLVFFIYNCFFINC